MSPHIEANAGTTKQEKDIKDEAFTEAGIVIRVDEVAKSDAPNVKQGKSLSVAQAVK